MAYMYGMYVLECHLEEMLHPSQILPSAGIVPPSHNLLVICWGSAGNTNLEGYNSAQAFPAPLIMYIQILIYWDANTFEKCVHFIGYPA